ncbi:MAG: hypothetical protein SOT67_05410 [Bacteroidaceae bacterium]|nr:hypothetical protein [Prevotellaceae bacterium]MDY2849683.1 hypothetical protein [Bacteroidaceae bacterium]
MKKTYIAPEMEIVRIEAMNVMATSIVVKEDGESSITESNRDNFEFNSNSFRGGLFDEE